MVDVDKKLKVLAKCNNLHYKLFTEASIYQKNLGANQELFVNLSGPKFVEDD